MIALQAARKEMATITSQLRIIRALLSKVPRKADTAFQEGDQVWIFRETDKVSSGTFPILRVYGKQLFILDGKREVQFSTRQAILVKDFDELENGDRTMKALHSVTK